MAISPETAATTRSIFSMLSRTPRRSTSTPWTLRGRRKRQPSSTRTTERRAKQEERRSPLTDSNRRPPPYHLLQIGALEGPEKRRATSQVSFLMCPFCVRGLLYVLTTKNVGRGCDRSRPRIPACSWCGGHSGLEGGPVSRSPDVRVARRAVSLR